MPVWRKEDAAWARRARRFLFLQFFVVLFVILVRKIPVLSSLFLFFVFVLFIEVIGNEIQVHGMSLRDLQLGLALRATQDFTFFDFVFVDVDFSGTFRAADHGSILRSNVRRGGAPQTVITAKAYYIPRCAKSTPQGARLLRL
jgi:hypothetical protein